MRAHCVGPAVELESFEQHEGPRLGNALENPEDSADVHERRVDDRNTATQLSRGRRPVTFRPHHAVRQHVVGEVHTFRRSGGSAGQHPHRDAGSLLVVRASLADRDHFRLVSETRDGHHCRGRQLAQGGQVVRLADDHWECELVDVCFGAFIAAGRVDDNHRRSGAQHTEERGNLRRAVAQQDSDLRLVAADERMDPLGQFAKLSPRQPLAVILQSRRIRLQPQNIVDAPTERVRCHRICGSGLRPSPRAASSAMPIGFPSRV